MNTEHMDIGAHGHGIGGQILRNLQRKSKGTGMDNDDADDELSTSALKT